MSSLQTLIEDNLALLEQGHALLADLSDEVYAAPVPSLRLSGPGPHLRHVLDFYARLFEGLADDGRVDYDRRARDPRVEVHTEHAREVLRATQARLRELSEDRALHVKSDSEGVDPGHAPWTRSSLERELQAVLSHTVHHYALMAVALRSAGVEPGDEFGVAPSTLRYWKEQRACAP